MTEPTPDPGELTQRLARAYPPEAEWKLEVKLETEPPTVGVHLREGNFRHAILVTHLRGGASDKDAWTSMYDTAVALYGMLLDRRLNSRDLPQGDEVGFGGATYKVVIEYTWAG